MIKIIIKEDHIEIDGHANYADYGKDIVCAAVSCIAITSINAIIKLDESALKYEENDGYLVIDILKHNKYVDTIISNMIDLLKELEEQYKKNIKIYEEVH